MTTIAYPAHARARRRAIIERVIARYPHVSQDELIDVIGYFRREASAADKARIAANSAIRRQYRRINRDHMIARGWLIDAAIWGGIAVALTIGFVLLIDV